MKSHGGMILTGENLRTQRSTCPSATLSTTNPTWTDPGENLGLRGERLANNRLSHGTAKQWCYKIRRCVNTCGIECLEFSQLPVMTETLKDCNKYGATGLENLSIL
jgi:hypothetical protein